MTEPPESGSDSITLHSSLAGIIAIGVGVVVLDVFAVGLLLSAGLSIASVVIGLVAVISSVVVLVDMPVASTFDGQGVIRRAVLRRHRVPWERVDRLARLRRGVVRTPRASPDAGLVAMVGSRRVMLVDRMEGRQEFELLSEILGSQAKTLEFDGLRVPPKEQNPTWLYRRAKWAPDGPKRR